MPRVMRLRPTMTASAATRMESSGDSVIRVTAAQMQAATAV